VPSINSVIVIDTTSLTVKKTIAIGSSPVGLSVSADGKKLWVANSGSTNFAIGVIDLNTLTTLPSLPAPLQPFDIKEGLGHRLYLTPISQSPDGGIMQIDAETGTFQKYLGEFEVYAGGFVEVTSDRRSLIFGNTGLSGSTMDKFDVATANSSLVQTENFNGGNGTGLGVSHNGQLIVYPNGAGDGTPPYTTFEIPTTNITSVNGSFNVGAYPVAAIFSNDDTLLYHGTSSQSAVKIFDTNTFTLIGTIPLGNNPNDSGGYDTHDLALDRTGHWLFVATSFYPEEGDLRVFDTGRSDVLPPPELANISTRLNVGQADNVLIGGFIITGNVSKKVIVRAIGPSLSKAGISNALADPTLELHDSSGIIATNDNWQTTQIGGIITTNQSSEIQNSGLAPKQAAESAIIATLAPGNYTAIVRGKANTTGVAVVETYDLNRAVDSKLANISTRGFVQTGDDVMIGGTIVTGSVSANVLIRAIGPSLTSSGVPNALQDPTLELHDSFGALVSSNDNWRTNQESAIRATGLAPKNNAESAILATLAPGAYTAIVRGKDNGTGVGLVEIYQLGN
jgi:YVTN family beta-propeller protein